MAKHESPDVVRKVVRLRRAAAPARPPGKYLVRRGDIFFFQIRAPKDLVPCAKIPLGAPSLAPCGRGLRRISACSQSRASPRPSRCRVGPALAAPWLARLIGCGLVGWEADVRSGNRSDCSAPNSAVQLMIAAPPKRALRQRPRSAAVGGKRTVVGPVEAASQRLPHATALRGNGHRPRDVD